MRNQKNRSARRDVRAWAAVYVGERTRLNSDQAHGVTNALKDHFPDVQISTLKNSVAWALIEQRRLKSIKRKYTR